MDEQFPERYFRVSCLLLAL